MPRKTKPPQTKPKAPTPDGLTYTVEQAGNLLGLCRASAYTAASWAKFLRFGSVDACSCRESPCSACSKPP